MRKIAGVTIAVTAMLAALPARPQTHDPLLRPVEPEYAAQWLHHQAPRRVFGNTYLVGFSGVTVALIRTDAGLILIDGALPQGVRDIEANIRAIGFDPKRIRYILSTEPHYDHASGIAALARDSGATVISSIWAAISLRSGRPNSDDPQAASLASFPPVTKVRTIRDKGTIRLGDVTVTAHATPGHTPGSMSWSWRSCEGKRCVPVVFAASFSPISADNWRFLDHPGQLAAFRRSFTAMRALPCGLLLTPHPGQSGGERKYAKLAAGAKPNPYLDPGACRVYADHFQRALDERLAKEKASGR